MGRQMNDNFIIGILCFFWMLLDPVNWYIPALAYPSVCYLNYRSAKKAQKRQDEAAECRAEANIRRLAIEDAREAATNKKNFDAQQRCREDDLLKAERKVVQEKIDKNAEDSRLAISRAEEQKAYLKHLEVRKVQLKKEAREWEEKYHVPYRYNQYEVDNLLDS
jgi:hypothetical protein